MSGILLIYDSFFTEVGCANTETVSDGAETLKCSINVPGFSRETTDVGKQSPDQFRQGSRRHVQALSVHSIALTPTAA